MAERHEQSELLRQRAFAVLAKGNIISNNHPLDYLEGDEGRDRMGIRNFFCCKNFFSDRFPSRMCRTHQISGVLEDGSFVQKPKKESIIRYKRGKTVQESPSSTTSPDVESEKKKSKVSCLELMLHKCFFIN